MKLQVITELFVSQKCTEYWPEDSVTYEGIEITIQQFIQADDYSLRIVTVKVILSGLDINKLKKLYI